MMLMERTVYPNGSTLSQNGQGPKPETVDPEIDKIAEQIKEANAKKMVQLHQTVVISTIQKKFVDSNKSEVEKSPDWTSVQGHFGWMEIGKELIPYILREDQKYVSDRMTKAKMLVEYKMIFTDEIWEYLPVKMITATPAEAKLLNEINVQHCDKSYGSEQFTENDKIFLLQDAVEGYEYLTFCYTKLTKMGCSEDQRCGFIKINQASLVPYVFVKGQKFVPLFYFEGDCEHLEKYAVELTGWDLAYLKFVCKIQGIRRTLYDHDEITVVELEHLKKFFLPGTEFEVSWDIQTFNKNDLLRPIEEVNRMAQYMKNSNQSKQGKKSTDLKTTYFNQIKPTGTYYPPYSKQNYQRHRANRSTNISNINTSQLQMSSLPQQQAIAPPQQQRLLNSQVAPLPQQQRAPLPQQQRAHLPQQQRAHLPQQQRAPLQQQQAPLQQQQYSTNYPRLNSLIQNGYPTIPAQANRSMVTPNVTNMGQRSEVYQIPEVDLRNPLQYFLIRKEISGKVLVGCINLEPFNPNDILVTLEELASSLFQIDLRLLKNALNAMCLDIYLPNSEQLNILRTVHLSNTEGLIKVNSLYDNLAQIKYILGVK